MNSVGDCFFVIADDPLNVQPPGYGNGDTITITFNMGTNTVSVATKAQLDAALVFSHSLGADYTGAWVTGQTLAITVVDATGAAPPAVGTWTVTCGDGSNGVKIRNTATTSFTCGTGAVLTGDFGVASPAGPFMTQFVADDPDDGDTVWSAGDTLTLVFSEATNMPHVGSKADVDALHDVVCAVPE